MDILGVAVDADEFPVFIPDVAGLGCQENFGAAGFDGLAGEPVGRTATGHIGGIEKVEAEVEGAVDGGNGFDVVLRPVELGHAHTAEAEGGNLWAVFADRK